MRIRGGRRGQGEPTANQFELVWALAEVHLAALTDDDLLWVPATNHWTVRRGEDGSWLPDWDLDEAGASPTRCRH